MSYTISTNSCNIPTFETSIFLLAPYGVKKKLELGTPASKTLKNEQVQRVLLLKQSNIVFLSESNPEQALLTG